jgi:hypothetical protein
MYLTYHYISYNNYVNRLMYSFSEYYMMLYFAYYAYLLYYYYCAYYGPDLLIVFSC